MLNEHDDIKAYAKLQSDAIDKHLKDVNDMAKGIVLTMWKPRKLTQDEIKEISEVNNTSKEEAMKHWKGFNDDVDTTMNILLGKSDIVKNVANKHNIDIINFKKVHSPKVDTLSSLWYELIQKLITKEEKQTMTTEQTLKVLEAMKAGKEILISDKTERPPHDGMWSGLNYDTKNLKLDTERYLYKVAPEYRPYNKNELDSLLGGVIRKKYDAASIHLITGVDKTNGRICVSEIWMTTNVLFEKYLYRNETPLGMEIK